MKIHIWDDYANYQIIIMGEVQRGDKKIMIGYNGKHLVEQEYNPQPNEEELIPLLKIPIIYRDFLPALLDALSNRNLKTENENLLQGKLDATKLHLDDMRDMTKQLIKHVIESPAVLTPIIGGK